MAILQQPQLSYKKGESETAIAAEHIKCGLCWLGFWIFLSDVTLTYTGT